MTRLSIALWLGLLCACDDPLKSVQRIEDLRVLAARAEVRDEPERAWPAPGETLDVGFLAVAPDARQALGWVFEACHSAAYDTALSPCVDAPFARVESDGVAVGLPRLTVTVPADLEPGSELSLRGIVCAGSEARADDAWPGYGCARASAQRVTTLLRLTVAGAQNNDNHNPSLADDTLELDQMPWEQSELVLDEQACAAGSPLPRVAADGAEHMLGLRLRGDDRESLPDVSGPAPRRETLELSHFATAGELARPYTFIEWDDPRAQRLVALSWSAPDESTLQSNEALLVRFYFVLRDGRGGSDWLLRGLCVTAP